MGTVTPVFYDSTLLVHFIGEVTIATSASMRQSVLECLTQQPVTHVVIDLSNVEFMDSSGIGMLVALKTRLEHGAKALFLLNPSPQVSSTINLVQLGSFFHVLTGEVPFLNPSTK